MTALAGWQNFYVIVGSSAGALIGLQFVVITLIANRPIVPGQGEAGSAFSTPNIVHFSVVLLLSAIMTVPWQALTTATIALGLVGLSGIAYVIVVARRMRTQRVYRPEFEDWLCHALLPFAAYATLAASALVERASARAALLAAGTAALSLLFIGIHNAWDAVTYHIFIRSKQARKPDPPVAEK
jgi:hypothetical protein